MKTLYLIFSLLFIAQPCMPQAITSDLLAIDFADSLVGTIVGADAIILRTTDGGVRWCQQQNTSSAKLTGVSMANPNVAVVLATVACLRTTDGGKLWTSASHSIPASATAMHVSMGNAQTGYALPQAVTNSGIWKTTDVGATWIQLPAATHALSYTDISAFNENIAIAAGSVNRHIPVTTDGGTTWTAGAMVPTGTTTSNYVKVVEMVTPAVGYAIQISAPPRKSTDGGATWTTVTTSLVPSTDIAFSTVNVGATVGTSDGIVGGKDFAITTDAGVTWEITSPAGDNAVLMGVSFATPSTIVIVGKNGLIYRSTDRGLSFTKIQAYSSPDSCLALSDVHTESSVAAPFTLAVYPQPFSSRATIVYTVPEPGRVKLYLTDMLGRSTSVLSDAFHDQGTHRTILDGSTFSQGVYTVRLITDHRVASTPLLHIH